MTVLDFIFLVAICALFYAGFWCGKTYGSIGAMFVKFKAVVSGWLK